MLPGSCTAADFKSCCLGLECYGSESHCSCDQDCYIVGDCCSDIATTCPVLAPGKNIYILHDNNKCVLVFIETTLPYLQAVSEHGEVLPPGGGFGGYVSIPLANGFPYGNEQFFQLFVSTDIKE